MPIEAVYTLFIFFGVILALISNRISPDLVLMAALTILLCLEIVTPEQALQGFANPSVLTIACLYVIASGLLETGAVNWLAQFLLGSPSTTRSAQLRVLLPTSFLSAVTNNTAVVTMFIPVLQEWGDRLKIPPSKLLIPLSYAAILGGTCTLIGTSTNIIIDGLLQQNYSHHMGLFEIAFVGIPVTAAGGLYLFFFSDKLLPNRGGTSNQVTQYREYCVEFEVDTLGPISGKSVTEAGLRSLQSGYLMEVHRGVEVFSAVSPNWILQKEDLLVFIGAPDLASELRKIRGLKAVEHKTDALTIKNDQRCLVEVILGADFPSIGESIRDSKFRNRFNAVVLSLSRDGVRQPGKLGDLKFKVGDMLLLETSFSFVEQYRFRKDFLLVSQLNNSTPPDYSKAPHALAILLSMIVSTLFGLFTILEATLLASGAMLAARCVTATKARRQIDLKVLTVIAASFALGAAMKSSGAADAIISSLFLEMASPIGALIIVYCVTALFTEIITNNAAAVLMFPIAQTFSERLEVSALPFCVAIMIGASASFVTPLGYQTNMMVCGPGQYKYTDFIKIGLPLSIIVGVMAICIIPVFWPF